MDVINAGRGQPELSVILTAYNQEAYVKEALESVLSQEGLVAEILVSDDCSSDRTFAIVQDIAHAYDGPHHLCIRRTKKNIGQHNNVCQLVEMAATSFIVMANGDDISFSHRCRRLLDEMRSTGADVLSSNSIEINAKGHEIGLRVSGVLSRNITASEVIRSGYLAESYGASMAWSKRVYQTLPSLDASRLPEGIDTVLPFRGALLGGMHYIDEPLLKIRRHAGQLTHKIFNQREQMMFQESLPSVSMFAYICMLRDLKYLMQDPSAAQKASYQPLHEELETRILQIVEEWMELRSELWNDGWRPDWKPKEEWSILSENRFKGFRESTRNRVRRLRWRLLRK